MQQLALFVAPPPEPSLENFVAGRNEELLSALANFVSGASPERFIYIWGAHGCGKSHLLQSLRSVFLARDFAVATIDLNGNMTGSKSASVVIADDVDRFDEAAQRRLFNTYNHLRDHDGMLVASAAIPSSQLPLRRDLVTRLAWGLVYQLHTLTDDEKAEAMIGHARARGFDLSSDVTSYLLRRHARDLPALLRLVEALDRYSMESKRAITVPLVRQLLAATREGAQADESGN